MNMIKPALLQPGDRVAAVTLSWGGPYVFPHRFEAGVRQIREVLRLEVVPSRHALRDPAWLLRNPAARADDLMEAFADPSIKGIISSIGGDDSIRIVPFIKPDIIRAHPKVFLGYSDATVTHLACLKSGLISFYGPSIMSGLAENKGIPGYLLDSLRRLLFDPDTGAIIRENQGGWTRDFLDWGDPLNQERRRAFREPSRWNILQGTGCYRGHLLGGCADVLEMVKQTDLWPSLDLWDNAILFLENSENAVSPQIFKQWLRNYSAIGVLDRIGGFLFGRPGHMKPEQFQAYDDVIQQVLVAECGRTDIPIVTQMDFGHTDPMFTLPYMTSCEIDIAGRRMTLGAAVS